MAERKTYLRKNIICECGNDVYYKKLKNDNWYWECFNCGKLKKERPGAGFFKKRDYVVRVFTNKGKKSYKCNCRSAAHAIAYILRRCYLTPIKDDVNKITMIDVHQ